MFCISDSKVIVLFQSHQELSKNVERRSEFFSSFCSFVSTALHKLRCTKCISLRHMYIPVVYQLEKGKHLGKSDALYL